MHKSYLSLKTHRNRQRENDRLNEDMFLGDLEELFDVAPTDVMTELNNDED